MQLDLAEDLAMSLLSRMSPYCERVRLAGSIRRRKPEVKDIEIVCIPRRVPVPIDLFGGVSYANLLHDNWAMADECPVRWIKPGTSEITDWPPKPDGKYWRGLLPDGIKLDLFLCNAQNWGAIYLIRTGCAEFSEAVVTHGKIIGMPFSEGYLTQSGRRLDTPSERDVFSRLGLEYVAPEYRTSGAAVRRKDLHE